jgi:hypothetical protein
MATRTIASPGVQINETDLSVIARSQVGTNVFMTGFANQGPTDEIVNISSVSEFESVFGTPTTEAERYLYHSARQVLTQSPGNLMVTRMAYGSGAGAGFANSYSALVYPVSAAYRTEVPSYSGNGTTTNLTVTAVNTVYYSYAPLVSTYEVTRGSGGENDEIVKTGQLSTVNVTQTLTYENANYFVILPPVSVVLSESDYQNVIANGLSWEKTYSSFDTNQKLTANDLKYGGILVLNPSKVALNELYEGYYVGLSDNKDNNPATNFTAITGMKTVTNGNGFSIAQSFVDISSNKLNFALSSSYIAGGGSISKEIEQYPTGYDFGSKEYNDCLSLMYFKVRSSIYAQDTIKLDYSVQEAYAGSLGSNRTQNNPRGGAPMSFSLERLVNQNSTDLKVIVNPYIAESANWTGATKTVRMADGAKNLYAQGVYSPSTINGDSLGDIPLKLQRVLQRIDDLEVDIDIIPEAGLGTIWAHANAKLEKIKESTPAYNSYHFDPTFTIQEKHLTDLKTQNVDVNSALRTWYQSIAQQFVTFAEKTRKDHMFIADPLRCIFANGPWDIQGRDKTVKKSNYIFSSDVYWPLKNLFANTVTSYGATYGNWLLFNDVFSNKPMWLPASGYVAADIALSSATSFPWSAPAGFSRGQLSNVLDLAINPTQKQRDLLYRVNVNPIAYFPGDGYVIFGQKTLFNKPSAFDRINVRRLFLTLEKITLRLLKYYTFEPNTFATRARLVNGLVPVFNQAKNNEGLYAYKIVCDERNNTPDVIDNNELRIAIYIQPVRTAEFILADFIATRTGADFNELTS